MNVSATGRVDPLFERYVIDKQYNIKKLLQDGTEIDIQDPVEKHKILDTNFLKGSIGITRDTHHRGYLHPLFYIGQIIHSFAHRHKNIDVNLCHGLVVLKQAQRLEGEDLSHPFITAHAVLNGIHTSRADELKDKTVTEMVYYRPLNRALRKKIVAIAHQTAYVVKPEQRRKNSPLVQPSFSISNLFKGLFYNGKHESGHVLGRFPSEKSMRSTAFLIADVMQGQQFLDDSMQGEPKPKDFFCIPYALGVFQGAMVLKDLKKIPQHFRKLFVHDEKGKALSRDELADKIFHSFRYKRSKDPVADQLWHTYWGNKLMRLHTDYLMGGLLAKKLDKLCQAKKLPSPSHHVVKFQKPEETHWLEHCVRAYKQKFHLPASLKNIITLTAKIFLIIGSCGLLLPLIYHLEDISRKIDLDEAAVQFHTRMKEKLSDEPQLRPKLRRIELPTDTSAFNHMFEFTIQSGILWHRRRDPVDNQWEPLFFDGERTGVKPVSLSTDGANLVVVDDQGVIHYRKILSEGRGYKDIYRSPSLRRHLKLHPEIQIHKQDTHSYFAVDKIEKPYWYTSWYNFPCLKRVVNAITGPKLISKGHISHLGKYSYGYADANGKFHLNPVGITTLYEMSSKGTSVCKYDPWAPTWSQVSIPLPRTQHTCYIASKIYPSASTLMAVGYEYNKLTGSGGLKILTNLCDIDTMGGNPSYHYAYQTEKKSHPEVRILPDRVENQGWREHPLPADILVAYNQINIDQTGPGNDAYELRLAAKTQDGRIGYYRKPNLQSETPWEFVPCDSVDTSWEQPLAKPFSLTQAAAMPFTPVYRGNVSGIQLTLRNFDADTYHAQIHLTFNGKKYELYLHKRLGWRTFLGRKHETFTLVIPEEQADASLLKIFKGRRAVPVDVTLSDRPTHKSVYLESDVLTLRLNELESNSSG